MPELKQQRKLSSSFFQQDGTTFHTAKKNYGITATCVRCVSHLSLRRFQLAASLAPFIHIRLFSLGYLKTRAYVSKPRMLAALENNIRHEISLISKETFAHVYENFSQRLEECIEKQSHHLDGIIFKS